LTIHFDNAIPAFKRRITMTVKTVCADILGREDGFQGVAERVYVNQETGDIVVLGEGSEAILIQPK